MQRKHMCWSSETCRCLNETEGWSIVCEVTNSVRCGQMIIWRSDYIRHVTSLTHLPSFVEQLGGFCFEVPWCQVFSFFWASFFVWHLMLCFWGSSIVILFLDYDAHLYYHISSDYDLFRSQMLYSDWSILLGIYISISRASAHSLDKNNRRIIYSYIRVCLHASSTEEGPHHENPTIPMKCCSPY